MAEPGSASPSNTAPEYQGRPIAVECHGSGRYVAYFRNEYDGATDSRHFVALGITEQGAVDGLIAMEEGRRRWTEELWS